MRREHFEDKTPPSLYKEKILRVIFVECYVERLLELNLVGQFVTHFDSMTHFVTLQQASTLQNKRQRKSPSKVRKRKKPQNIVCSETS